MTRKRKIKITVGDIVKINIGNDFFCFARVIENALMAFYEIKTKNVPSLINITSSPVLFKIAVMNYAITSGHWEVIGNIPLEKELEVSPFSYKYDKIGKKYSLYREIDGRVEEIPATKEECEGLECAAVWDPHHVEDRLRDHFAGVPNKWVESLKVK